MIEISAVERGGIAARAGIRRGDRIISVNGEETHDVIDYRFQIADEHASVRFETSAGKRKTIRFDKDPCDTLGLEFVPLSVKRCRNKCIFCFVDQMPPGCRKSLYVKDDDFRASFLYGNYITLANLTEKDWQRIFSQRLSPLYVSVHSTDPALRSFLTGNSKSPKIMTSLRRLAAGGIRIHAQIVLCPGLNDGERLNNTLRDLSDLFPAVASIAVVPVGLTALRNGLYPLRTFKRREAAGVIEEVVRFGNRFKRRHGTRLAFVSDEFFIQAGLPVPPPSFYEDFSQIENGVGMVAEFLRNAARTRLPRVAEPHTVTLVTGLSFYSVLRDSVRRRSDAGNLSIRVIAVRNSFFGSSVTVAGLLTGVDIAAALAGKRLGDLVVVPGDALKAEGNIFLDGMSLAQLSRDLGVRTEAAHGMSDIAALVWKGRKE